MLGPLLALVSGGLIGFILYLAFNRSQRQEVLSKVDEKRKEVVTKVDEKKKEVLSKVGVEQEESSKSSQGKEKKDPTYEDVFPPSRRHVLAELPDDCLKGPGKSAKELAAQEPDYSKMLPDKANADDPALKDHSTATGFTWEEIKRLGDFPDYAALSGIPLPQPYPEFTLKTALERPYRPFRWPYHQTMSLSKLDHDFWLELYHEYVEVLQDRVKKFEQHGEYVLRTLPGSELATKELMEMCLDFLTVRYPHLFRLDKEKMVFYNDILKNQTDLKTTLPMHVLLHNVPEDFAIMIRDPETGIYSFRGGVIMSSLGWSLGSKIGLKLHEIHDPIPDYRQKMKFSMDRYFAKKPTDSAIQRGSWGLEIDKPLYMPPGDPHEELREAQNPEHTLDQVHLRVDWQTLRRLPLSGAIVFNFKGLFTQLKEFRDEAYIPSLVLKNLKEAKQNIMEYKNTWHTEHISIPALEEYEKEQIEKGMIEKDWEPATLEEHPFYPGWEEKWHRKQGF